jgi:hypothetical protein
MDLHPLDGPIAVIRTDPAPGFVGLRADAVLKQHRITLDIGRIKNVNKNPVAEKAVLELEEELLRQVPGGGSCSSITLATATARLNSRIRQRGLSAREMFTQRDQFTGHQLPIKDRELIMSQHELRVKNHPHSERSKMRGAPRGKPVTSEPISIGDLVYVKADRNKSQARERYLVISIVDDWCYIRKFVGSQLRSTSYKVKLSDCYKVPDHTTSRKLIWREPFGEEEESGDEVPLPKPPDPPNIPQELSTPAGDEMSSQLPELALTGENSGEDQCQKVVVDNSHNEFQDVTPGNMPADKGPLNTQSNVPMDSEPTYDSDLVNKPTRQSIRSRRPPKYLKEYST